MTPKALSRETTTATYDYNAEMYKESYLSKHPKEAKWKRITN